MSYRHVEDQLCESSTGASHDGSATLRVKPALMFSIADPLQPQLQTLQHLSRQPKYTEEYKLIIKDIRIMELNTKIKALKIL